ncbi:hypothetical protein Fmac_001742 [Flemingia macrophylla]|uniref:LisH domain-containing protein n=1 Tax=Flemingia macrophylla TaxID=520843 RepID=A0ABD1NHY5_9FABA
MNPRNPRSKMSSNQVAVIVHRYLALNHFSGSSSHFLKEAGSLIDGAVKNKEVPPLHFSVPSSVVNLGEMLDEYMCFKEQKMLVDQEWATLEQEKNNFRMVMQNLQNEKALLGQEWGALVQEKNNCHMVMQNLQNERVLLDQKLAALMQEKHNFHMVMQNLQKEKVLLDQELASLMQEKNNFHMVMQNLQNVVNAYSTSFKRPPPLMSTNLVPPPSIMTTSGVSIVASTSQNASAPMFAPDNRKRKDMETVQDPTTAKKCRGRPPGSKNRVPNITAAPMKHCSHINTTVSPTKITPVDTTSNVDANRRSHTSQVETDPIVTRSEHVKSQSEIFESEFDQEVDTSGINYSDSDMGIDFSVLDYIFQLLSGCLNFGMRGYGNMYERLWEYGDLVREEVKLEDLELRDWERKSLT